MTGGLGEQPDGELARLAALRCADLYVTYDNRIPILWAVGRLNFQLGTVISDRTLLDTQKSVLHVGGQVTLQSQVVNTQVKIRSRSICWTCTARPSYSARSVRPRYRSAASFPSRRPSLATPRPSPATPRLGSCFLLSSQS